jgi:hypothetical protein
MKKVACRGWLLTVMITCTISLQFKRIAAPIDTEIMNAKLI